MSLAFRKYLVDGVQNQIVALLVLSTFLHIAKQPMVKDGVVIVVEKISKVDNRTPNEYLAKK